ncbi:MAG: helix-turn-helix transcriptional regulator [Flexistipes sinusarabici]|uniref:Helix-turn-helix transcriptional regulator n=1 Tax=Flexistipes sinusarabici TaxID=2352 RepID=A0A5D0MLQ9_FLESI|nr:helix-turn-helix transcriptional regulator [Flexistipes sinusarabici]TYB32543.1 MAG: helix-turn-helix transcriptional regulator [Flexistipes sinusarabici]
MKNRPLYMISVVAEILGIHPQTLRQYERLGLINPSRTIGNTRLYSEDDIEQIKFILTLTKDLGVNLAGVEVVLNIKQQLEETQKQLDLLRDFIRKHADSFDMEHGDKGLVPLKNRDIIKVKIENEDE